MQKQENLLRVFDVLMICFVEYDNKVDVCIGHISV